MIDVILEQPLGQRFIDLALADTDVRVREDRGVSPGFLFATLLWHEVLATWKAARAGGAKPIPALFEAMDKVLDEQAKKIAVPRRFEATIKEIWSLQPRFEQRAGQRPFRLLEHPRYRAGWDFLELRCKSGELEGELAGLADWWDRFANAGHEAREAMLRPEEGPKRRSRSRGRGRKQREDRRGRAAGWRAAARVSAALAYLGLGSNLAHPRRQLARALRAIARLPRTSVVGVSPNYASAPVGAGTPQPDYVNAVAVVRTNLAPRALLARLHTIERRQRRRRDSEPTRNAPRTLDLDLLLYGRRRIRLPGLTVPHPRMHERAFVLRPLADVAAVATIPGRGLARRFLVHVRDQRIARTRTHFLR